MSVSELDKIRQDITNHPDNAWAKGKGWGPIYTVHPDAKINIIGQAPGRLAQESGVPWDDPSGRNLRMWMGIDDSIFYDPTKIALLPMDFYFPGSAQRGDLPPRKDFADKWHAKILAHMPNIAFTIVIGAYAQARILGGSRKANLTQTVLAYTEYLPSYFPLVHPSPRNNIWQKRNPWFAENVLPNLRDQVKTVLAK